MLLSLSLILTPAGITGRIVLTLTTHGLTSIGFVTVTSLSLSHDQLSSQPSLHSLTPSAPLVLIAEKGMLATCQESTNTYNGQMTLPPSGSGPGNGFMGPTLFSSSKTKMVNSMGDGTWNNQSSCDSATEQCFFLHEDMLHESPLCAASLLPCSCLSVSLAKGTQDLKIYSQADSPILSCRLPYIPARLSLSSTHYHLYLYLLL